MDFCKGIGHGFLDFERTKVRSFFVRVGSHDHVLLRPYRALLLLPSSGLPVLRPDGALGAMLVSLAGHLGIPGVIDQIAPSGRNIGSAADDEGCYSPCRGEIKLRMLRDFSD